MGETEATCTSCTETTATTAVSQDAASSSIERLVNRSSSSERCTPLSGIGKKLKQRKASEESRATGDLLQQRRCRDELKTSSALSAIGPSGKFLFTRFGYTYFTALSSLQYILLAILWYLTSILFTGVEVCKVWERGSLFLSLSRFSPPGYSWEQGVSPAWQGNHPRRCSQGFFNQRNS